MTRTTGLLATIAVLSGVVASPVQGDVHRRITDRRPFIVDVGEPMSITTATLQREARRIHQLDEYMGLYGVPDYAEVQEVEPQWPWEAQEVRVYYLQRNLEMDFGHVFLSSAMPNYGAVKFQGEITPDKRHQIEIILQAREAPPAPPVVEPAPPVPPEVVPAAEQPAAGGLTEALVARIEAAAERAARAADQAAADSEAATRAADRTTQIIEKMGETAP